MYIALRAIVLLLLLSNAHANSSSGPGSKKSKSKEELFDPSRLFVFVSGWPQSGTSLVQQIFTIFPHASTMVERCALYHGKKCLNWNNEGQWLLGNVKVAKDQSGLRPGEICPDEHVTAPSEKSVQQAIVREWSQYWDLSKKLLVEKSPQSMLKMDYYRAMFDEARQIKFLIVVKHPATLNIATPKERDWTTRTEMGEDGSKPKVFANTDEELVENIRYFIDFLSHNASYAAASSAAAPSTCSMGWLPAMHLLVEQLKRSKDASSQLDVRIIRYEHFERPGILCRALFHFLSDQETDKELYMSGVRDVCDVHLKTQNIVSTASGGQVTGKGKLPFRRGHNERVVKPKQGSSQKANKQRRRALEEDEQTRNSSSSSSSSSSSIGRRNLRLFVQPSTSATKDLIFQPELVTRSVYERMKNFNLVYKHDATQAYKASLDAIDAKLKPFGYSLVFGQHDLYRRQRTLFDPWDLMMNYRVALKKQKSNTRQKAEISNS